jgi:acetolactate synthase-1/2/3 large subunit
VHVYPGAEELGRVYRPHLAIHASPHRFAEALDAMTPPASAPWADQTRAAHDEYLAWSQTPVPQPGAVNLSAIVIWLRENLPDDTILCNGAGNYASWIHRFYRFRQFATQIAPISASMGYGVPSAVAMQLLHPARKVVSINGDGDFLMNGQEFATAIQYKLPIIVLVFDNSLYGTIRMHQEREYPGRVIATELVNPDFAAYARSFGGFGAQVEKTEDFAAAFRAAEASGLPSILHVKYDGEGITPVSTLSAIRAQAKARP